MRRGPACSIFGRCSGNWSARLPFGERKSFKNRPAAALRAGRISFLPTVITCSVFFYVSVIHIVFIDILEEEKYLMTCEELLSDLRTMLGGRAAEQVVFGIKTTGASNDLQRATALAKSMVTEYGMSEELGLMAPAANTSEYLDGQSYLNCSEGTSAKIDSAVQALLAKAYEDAKATLMNKRALLDEISEYLLAKETITGDELMSYINADQSGTENTAE